ncbi:hypothetical protein EZE20_03475 [Arundinibacter roseus]|uniref:DUF5103 domain-containing protein n=2 Tax=Arundinibacter roseus TaxID=2070510 RepID=A0A4R4KJ24_9BACT|nr:hypothetical protein EZE20_03475 [Arundinibacter roseus]
MWLLSLLILSQTLAFAQLEQTTRIEIPTREMSNEQFDVFSLGDQGALMVIRRNDYLGTRNEQWVFTKFNTDLNVSWTQEYKMDFRYIPIMSYQNPYYAYWLFAEPDTDHFLFLQLDLERGLIDIHRGDLLANVSVNQFKVIGSKALVSGYYRNRPVVIVHSFFDHTTRVLPGLFERNMEINNIDVNEQEGLINVITYSIRKKECLFTIKTYNYEGKPLKSTVLKDPQNSLISGQIVPLNADDSYLIGNYSVGCTPFSQGLYVTHIDDNIPETPQFIEFSELQNFFNYMKPKRRQRMLDRIGKRKSLGKENKFRYRLLVHDLIQKDDEIILVAEVYYPNYKTNSPATFNGLSRQYMRSMDGFRYTHAIVCGFDRQGNFLWDNCIAIKDLTSYELREMVQLTPIDNYFLLAYPQDGDIHTEVIRREKVVVAREKYEIEARSENEKVLLNENATLAAWYDRYFLAYGIQRVGLGKNPLPGSAQREVFYINKFTYNVDENGEPKETKEASRKKSDGSKR